MDREQAFVKIIREHEGLILKITSFYTDNRQDQQDLYQEIVYQLWKGFDSFRGESKFTTWMYRVGLNTAITQLKDRKKQVGSLPVEEWMLRETDAGDPVFEERIRVLYRQIRQLNDLEKGLILLFLEGNTYAEIADILGMSSTNVGTRLTRIKAKLRDRMIK